MQSEVRVIPGEIKTKRRGFQVLAGTCRATQCSCGLDLDFDLDVDLVLDLEFDNSIRDKLLQFRHLASCPLVSLSPGPCPAPSRGRGPGIIEFRDRDQPNDSRSSTGSAGPIRRRLKRSMMQTHHSPGLLRPCNPRNPWHPCLLAHFARKAAASDLLSPPIGPAPDCGSDSGR